MDKKVDSGQGRYESGEWPNDLEALIKRARIAAGIDWDIMCSLGVRNILRECANAIESLRKAERDYGEPLDAIRQALGQEGTHFLDELEEFQFGWLKTALLKCGYREDVQALRHFVFHARLNGASNTCLLCLRSCDEDDEGHLADCPYFVALERVSAPGVETLVEWADRQ